MLVLPPVEYPKDIKLARYFFRSHSFDELEGWTSSMQFFRFCRAIGGHANDGDELLAALRFDGEQDLLDLCSKLGFPLREMTRTSAPGDSPESSRSLSPIEAFPRFARPCHVEVAGMSVFVWIGADRLELTLSGAAGDPYEVDERDVEKARCIEQVLLPLLPRVIDPPMQGERCFTK